MIRHVYLAIRMLNKTGPNSKKLLTTQTPLRIQTRNTMGDTNQISMENPLSDYKRLIGEMMNANLDDEEQMTKYKDIAASARNTVWKLLFDDPQPPSDERMKKAADLLKEHKTDACFFVPWDYNDWVVNLRDEILKRQMIDYWRNVIVKEELGLCSARDSDYFDDIEDEEPIRFYEHAGCKAPWLDETEQASTNAAVSSNNFVFPTASGTSNSTNNSQRTVANYAIGWENPLVDYKNIVKKYLTENDSSNDEEIETIFDAIAESARQTVWSLLFDDPQPPSIERQVRAGDLLKEHKTDAGFYAPWIYNEWVIKFRDEILKREFLEFWRTQMVKRELGLCWARDSDYFDNMEDEKPVKFYEHAGCRAPWLKEQDQNQANERKSGDDKKVET